MRIETEKGDVSIHLYGWEDDFYISVVSLSSGRPDIYLSLPFETATRLSNLIDEVIEEHYAKCKDGD